MTTKYLHPTSIGSPPTYLSHKLPSDHAEYANYPTGIKTTFNRPLRNRKEKSDQVFAVRVCVCVGAQTAVLRAST